MGKVEAQGKARAKRLWDNYGITPEEWQIVWTFQKGVCWACQRLQKSGKRLATDHDHASGLFRSLLCSACNRLLGRIERSYPKGTDIIVVIRRLLEVLTDHPAVKALNKQVFGYAGRTGTKKQRAFLKRRKKNELKANKKLNVIHDTIPVSNTTELKRIEEK